jgi:hypothetical protein
MLEEYKKKCVYGAITGDYDYVREVKIKAEGFDYILFTNNKDIKSSTWDVRYLDNEDDLDNVRLARQVKHQYYKYVPDYDLTLWVDGNVEIVGNVLDFIKTLPLEVSDFFVSKHPHRQNIFQEAQTCVQLGKDSYDNIANQITQYKLEGIPPKLPLVESGVLLRKNTKKIRKFCDFWFEQVMKYTPRDQLSFTYTLWRNPMNVFLFPAFRDYYRNVFILGHKHDKHDTQR